MTVKSFTFGPFQTNTHVVSVGENVLLIDPACSNEYERQVLRNYIEGQISENRESGIENRQVSIVASHGHLDHLWGAKWATDLWHTPVLMHEADIHMATAMQEQYNMFGISAKAESFPIESLPAERSVSESGLSSVSEAVRVLHTPGHTPGSVCFYWPNEKVLISGDTLFCMGYGRTDLPGGDIHQLSRSLYSLFELPSDVIVYPGHGESTTIGAEKSRY